MCGSFDCTCIAVDDGRCVECDSLVCKYRVDEGGDGVDEGPSVDVGDGADVTGAPGSQDDDNADARDVTDAIDADDSVDVEVVVSDDVFKRRQWTNGGVSIWRGGLDK